MDKQKEYKIFIEAIVRSTLTDEELEKQLVASLYDIDTEEKTSDGDGDRFEVVEYYSTRVAQSTTQYNDTIAFIADKIKVELIQILDDNQYDETYLSIESFSALIHNKKLCIQEYRIGRIYTFAEVYFQLVGKSSPYGVYVEKIAEYDTTRDA